MSSKIKKTEWKPGTQVAPAPPALVSCRGLDGRANVLTIAWCGNVCSEPPMVSISVRPGRFSYPLIMQSQEFVVNLPTQDIARQTDWCGVMSGRDHDKFASTGLETFDIEGFAAPGIVQCPVNIACRVEHTLNLGTHVMFVGRVERIMADARYMDKKGRFHIEKTGLLCYAHGDYYGLGSHLGKFGFSVRKKG